MVPIIYAHRPPLTSFPVFCFLESKSPRGLCQISVTQGLEYLARNHFESQAPFIIMLGHSGATSASKNKLKQMGDEEKKVVVQEEMKRMHQLPSNSSYATHRLRVLNKILQLMSIQRSATQEEELQLLFAGLSI